MPKTNYTVVRVINQVSHSKKWASEIVDVKQVKSYSLLQDKYYNQMVVAGFDGFKRGERGSTAEHLDVLDYKSSKTNSEPINCKQKQGGSKLN